MKVMQLQFQALNLRALCFGEEFNSEERDLHYSTDKLTLKNNTISYCFTLFIFGGPCHISRYKQCSGDLIFC